MIQRIQSVYLLGAFILLGLSASLLFVMPEVVLSGYRMVFVTALGLLGLAGLGSVFLYRNRELQAKIVKALGMVSILLIVCYLLVFYAGGDLEMVIAAGALGAVIGLVAVPVVAMVLFFRAYGAIRRDIELIRSMDRLR